MSTGTTIRILLPTDPVKIRRKKKTVTMAAKTRELTAYGARKEKFFRRDFGDLEVQIGVRDVTSPVAVLGITDFGNNWGERAWNRISGQRGTSFGK